MEDCVIKTIDNFDMNFWIDLNKDYLNCLAVKMFPLKNYLQIYYRFNNEEVLEFATKIEFEVYENLKKEIMKRSKEISMSFRFKADFVGKRSLLCLSASRARDLRTCW